MIIRFGYVASALNLGNITSSSALTFTRYKKLSDEERINELKRVTRSNLEALKQILEYNIRENIHFYRLTSKLIPLATHPEVKNWDYKEFFYKEFEEIGDMVKKNNLRVDTHPDHFNVINSTREEVFEATKRELLYHNDLFEMMDYDEGKMILHMGGAKNGKEVSINRFLDNFNKLANSLKSRIILENDDKSYNILDTLYVCKKLGIPMVLDYHHYICNRGDEVLEEHIDDILNTWNNELLIPKVHIAGPKEGEYDRAHADFLAPDIFFCFLEYLKIANRDVDVMIESKMKDKALLKLIKDIKDLKPEIKWIDETTMEI